MVKVKEGTKKSELTKALKTFGYRLKGKGPSGEELWEVPYTDSNLMLQNRGNKISLIPPAASTTGNYEIVQIKGKNFLHS